MTEPLQLLTVRQAAVVLNVHVNTLLRMIERDEIKVYRVGTGHRIRISPNQIEDYLRRAET